MFVVGPLNHLYYCLVIGLTTLQFAFGDDDVVNEGGVLRNEEGHILLHTQTTHDGIMSTTDNLDDHGLLDVLIATGHIRHLYLVAIHSRHGVALGHEHGGATIIGQERVAPVGLTTEDTLLNLSLQIKAI